MLGGTLWILGAFALAYVCDGSRMLLKNHGKVSKSTSANNQPEFDYFMFVRQWPGGYCSSHSCSRLHLHGYQFTIHGLWPNYDDGRWPQFCDPDLPFRESDIDDLSYVMDDQWPSFSGDNEVFWSHEWNKHGTCALHVLPNEHNYFKTTLKLNYKYDLAAAFHAGGITPSRSTKYSKRAIVDAIYQLYGVDVQLHCTPNGDLMEVWMCMDKYLHPFTCRSSSDSNYEDYCARGVRVPPPSGLDHTAQWIMTPQLPSDAHDEREHEAEGEAGSGLAPVVVSEDTVADPAIKDVEAQAAPKATDTSSKAGAGLRHDEDDDEEDEDDDEDDDDDEDEGDDEDADADDDEDDDDDTGDDEDADVDDDEDADEDADDDDGLDRDVGNDVDTDKDVDGEQASSDRGADAEDSVVYGENDFDLAGWPTDLDAEQAADELFAEDDEATSAATVAIGVMATALIAFVAIMFAVVATVRAPQEVVPDKVAGVIDAGSKSTAVQDSETAPLLSAQGKQMEGDV